jgi:hypothetical protein
MSESSNEPQISDTDADRMVVMRKAGLTLDEISRVYDIREGDVYAVLRKRMPADELRASRTIEPSGEVTAALERAGEPQPAAEPAPARPGRNRRRILITGFAAAVVIGAGLGVGLALPGAAAKNTGAPTGAGAGNYVPAPTLTDPDGGTCTAFAADGYCPGDSPSPPAPATPATSPPPQYTLSQEQAIDAAETYLSEDTGWSQAGLIAQLSSSYGNGFSVADATVAVDSLTTVNWNQQAVLSAQSYMNTEPGWSACSLVQQLDSPYGAQFTQAEAEYASEQVGLGSC